MKRIMRRALCALLTAGLLGCAARADSWGLSFPTPGQPPVGNASADRLAQFDARFLGDTGEPTIYLTFDAGYESGDTPAILDALAKHNAPAAFFVTGNYLEQNGELVCRMVSEGHIVGNHTYHHPAMADITDQAAFSKELTDLEALYTRITGEEMPKYYRPPRGEYSEANLTQAKALGYRTVLWSLAYVDWYQDDQPTREEAFSKLLPRIHNGAVVLLHATSATNAAILDELLGEYEAMGYRFGTLEELFGDCETGPDPV